MRRFLEHQLQHLYALQYQLGCLHFIVNTSLNIQFIGEDNDVTFDTLVINCTIQHGVDMDAPSLFHNAHMHFIIFTPTYMSNANIMSTTTCHTPYTILLTSYIIHHTKYAI